MTAPPGAGTPRWPLHPCPGPAEALSSWLDRTASLYGMSAADLLRHNLGSVSFTLACRAVRCMPGVVPAAAHPAGRGQSGVVCGRRAVAGHAHGDLATDRRPHPRRPESVAALRTTWLAHPAGHAQRRGAALHLAGTGEITARGTLGRSPARNSRAMSPAFSCSASAASSRPCMGSAARHVQWRPGRRAVVFGGNAGRRARACIRSGAWPLHQDVRR
jgi:hypothetical protein